MISTKKDELFDKTEKQAMLAKKTLEHLQVITIAEVILKEKFNGDQNSWVLALFEALSLKNPVYLMEENEARDIGNDSLNIKFDDSFWNKENYDCVTTTSYHLISSFKKLMIGLNKNSDSFNLGNCIPDLKCIEKDIKSYLCTIKQDDVKLEVDDKSAFEQPTSTKEKDFVRKPDMSQLCPECNTKITIFNNDIEFSYQLHCQEATHMKATIKPVAKAASEQTTKVFEKRRPEVESFTLEDQAALRMTLNEKIKKHAYFIRILTKRDFHCDVCKCAISSLQNVISHVEGTKHTNAWKSFGFGSKAKSSDDILKIDHTGIPTAKLL